MEPRRFRRPPRPTDTDRPPRGEPTYAFDPFPDDCCQSTAEAHVDDLLGRRRPPRVFQFLCPRCDRYRTLTLREAPPASPLWNRNPAAAAFEERVYAEVHRWLYRDADLLHRHWCPERSDDAPLYTEDEDVASVLARTLDHDGEPQPCPVCLGWDVEVYLGVPR